MDGKKAQTDKKKTQARIRIDRTIIVKKENEEREREGESKREVEKTSNHGEKRNGNKDIYF